MKREASERPTATSWRKAHYKEGEFDQVDRILYDLKHNPLSRRIMSNIYNHHDLSEMNLYPVPTA